MDLEKRERELRGRNAALDGAVEQGIVTKDYGDNYLYHWEHIATENDGYTFKNKVTGREILVPEKKVSKTSKKWRCKMKEVQELIESTIRVRTGSIEEIQVKASHSKEDEVDLAYLKGSLSTAKLVGKCAESTICKNDEPQTAITKVRKLLFWIVPAVIAHPAFAATLTTSAKTAERVAKDIGGAAVVTAVVAGGVFWAIPGGQVWGRKLVVGGMLGCALVYGGPAIIGMIKGIF